MQAPGVPLYLLHRDPPLRLCNQDPPQQVLALGRDGHVPRQAVLHMQDALHAHLSISQHSLHWIEWAISESLSEFKMLRKLVVVQMHDALQQ